MASSMKVGAAWWKQDRNGNDYLSLSISSPVPLTLLPDQRLSLFANQAKEHENQPDYDLVILAERDRDRGQDDFSPDQQPRQQYRQTPAPQYAPPEDFADPSARQAAPRTQAPMAPRQAAPPARTPAPAPARAPQQARAAAPGRGRQPAPPPDYDPNSDLEDPFAE